MRQSQAEHNCDTLRENCPKCRAILDTEMRDRLIKASEEAMRE